MAIDAGRRYFPFQLILALLLGIVQIVGAGHAVAHDHKPPRAVVLEGAERNVLDLVSYCWTAARASDCADGPIRFGAPDSTRSDYVEVQIRKEQPPRDVSVRIWTELDEYGEPSGDSALMAPIVYPRVIREKLTWIVVILLSEAEHHYAAITARWGDEDAHLVTQDATWSLHTAAENNRSLLSMVLGSGQKPPT